MPYHRIIFIVFVGTFLNCKTESGEVEDIAFKLPFIFNSHYGDTLNSSLFMAELITEIFPIFAGKYKFKDTIDVNPETIDKIAQEDYFGGYSSTRLGDSADVNGFELYVDYSKSVLYNNYYKYDKNKFIYYPVYFVNSTNSNKVFFGKDSYAFGIQEARDKAEQGFWRPIECRGFDFCGNGHWAIIVHPRELVLILMRKYDGNYETEMRVRYEVGDNIFVSKPFVGKICESQFYLRESSRVQKRLHKTEATEASWLFYGAIPKEEEWGGKSH